MKSFIIALLPGLEEETGEYFEKVLPHELFGNPLAQPRSGTRTSRSVIWDRVPLIFLAKYLVDYVDEPA
jgi:hypothetical protein